MSCSETVQILFKYCSDPVQLLFTYCSPRTGDTVFEQFLNRSIFSNKFLMLLSRNCSKTVLILFIQFINWTGVNRSWTVLEQAYIYELIWTVFELYLDSIWTGLYVCVTDIWFTFRIILDRNLNRRGQYLSSFWTGDKN